MSVVAAPSVSSPRPDGRWLFPIAVLCVCWLWPVSVSWRIAADLGHAWAVPLLIAYLWWERWQERPALLARPRLATGWIVLAVMIGLAQLPLRLLFTPFPLWPMLMLVYTGLFVIVAAAGAWLFAGVAGLRWLLGPMVLLVSALPAPTMIEMTLIMPLRRGMAALAAEISNVLGHPALASGTSIQLANSWVGVDDACGGIRSLQACVMIGLFFGEWYRFSWLRRIALLVAAVLAAIAGNFGRVLFLSLRAHDGGHSVEAAHDAAGWIAMAASLALTGFLACRWAGYRWPPQITLARPAGPHSTAWIFLAVIAGCFGINEVATRAWYAAGGTRYTPAHPWTARLPEKLPSFEAQPLAQPAREMLRPDLYTAGSWSAGGGLSVSAYYIEWHRGQSARSVPFLHNPTVCLPLSGCELIDTLPPMTINWRGTDIPFHTYKFRRAGEDMLVAFVIWDSGKARPLDEQRSLNDWWDWFNLQWSEVTNARENMPAQLLTVTILARTVELAPLRRQVESLLGEP